MVNSLKTYEFVSKKIKKYITILLTEEYKFNYLMIKDKYSEYNQKYPFKKLDINFFYHNGSIRSIVEVNRVEWVKNGEYAKDIRLIIYKNEYPRFMTDSEVIKREVDLILAVLIKNNMLNKNLEYEFDYI